MNQDYYMCTSYCFLGKCTHQAAPRRIFGAAKCILWLHERRPVPGDPRIEKNLTCALYTPEPWQPRQPDPNP